MRDLSDAARRAQAFEPTAPNKPINPRRWDVAIIAGAAGLAVGAILCAAAAALAEPMHSTSDPGHWYDPECCSLRDCAPIPRDRVKLGRAGAVVRLSRGDHPTVEGSVERFFRDPAVEVQGQKAWRWSQDDNWHACITPGAQQFICLYAPRGGT